MVNKKTVLVLAMVLSGSMCFAQSGGTSSTGSTSSDTSSGSTATTSSPSSETSGSTATTSSPSSETTGGSTATTSSPSMGTETASQKGQFQHYTVTFEKGSSKISETGKKQLMNLVNQAKKGDIDDIEVAAWSDKQHPGTGSLPRADRKLADDRLEAVKDMLHEEVSNLRNITDFNMAEGSNWLARTFRTDEAQLDAVFAKKESTVERQDFDIIKKEGGPSKAVVIFKMK